MNTILLFMALALSLANDMPELNDRTYERWEKHILPQPEELRWREIPWRNSFWQGVVEAHEQDKPILVWAMNGHPLACT